MGKVYERARSRYGMMPPLRHSQPGQAFDLTKSEVCRWLADHSWQSLFDLAQESGAIVYDQVAGTWRGKDWKAD